MSKLEFTSKTLSEMSIEKLTEKLVFLKRQLFNLRFQKALGELDKMSRFAEVKKNIARIKTEINKKRKFNA